MRAMPHIVNVMTPFPHSIEAGAPLSEAQVMMGGAEIRHLPVVDEGKLVGVLSDRELQLTLALSPPAALRTMRVSDVANLDAYMVESSERLDTVLTFMAEHRIGATLVTKNGKLVGIFTMTDVCRLYAESLKITHPDA